MATSYRNFASWVLTFVSFRDLSEEALVVFSGNRVRHYLVAPVRAAGESTEAFERRQQAWKARIPRGCDWPSRIALAHEAFVRDGYRTWQAAHQVVETLKLVAYLAKKHKQLYSRLFARFGISWRTFKVPVGFSSRRWRTKRKKPGISKHDRIVERVRTAASQYKSKHDNFRQLFEASYGCYLHDNQSDEWFQRYEHVCRSRFERNRNDPVMADTFLIASEAWGLARMYRNVGRVANAAPLYEFALDFWKTHGDQCPHLQADNMRKLQEEIKSLSSNAGCLPC